MGMWSFWRPFCHPEGIMCSRPITGRMPLRWVKRYLPMKTFQKPELIARVKSLVRVKSLLDELEDARNVIFSLAITLDFNDPYTHGHSQRVSELATRLSNFMGLSSHEKANIRDAGLLHDIGKIATDKDVLHKPSSLNGNEYEHVKQHPVIGEKICSPLHFAKALLPIIL